MDEIEVTKGAPLGFRFTLLPGRLETVYNKVVLVSKPSTAACIIRSSLRDVMTKWFSLTRNNDNEKIGDIAELIVDRSGKLEALVVGAGGFLGLNERDVAIPYGQISWSFQRPGLSGTSTSTAPPTTGAGRLDLAGSPYRGETLLAPAGPNSENARTYPDNRAGAIIDSAQERGNSGDALSYPDHAVLNMTKDQLKAAPAFKFSR
jgi:hypothetical protein